MKFAVPDVLNQNLTKKRDVTVISGHHKFVCP